MFENLVVTEFLKAKFNRELSGREDKPAFGLSFLPLKIAEDYILW